MKTNAETTQFLSEWLTRAEVADYCRVSKETIRRWEAQGKLAPRIINARVYRYNRGDIMGLFDV